MNTTNIAQNCHIKRTTVSGYLEILQGMLLAYMVPVFKERCDRKTFLQSKFYLIDTDIYRALRSNGVLENPWKIEEAALEGLVGQHLRVWCDSSSEAKLYYLRTYTGQEVDFVIYEPSIFAGIEVKNTNSVKRQDLQSLKAFSQLYPKANLIAFVPLHRNAC